MRVGRHEMIISDSGFRMSSKSTPGVVMNGTIGDESVSAVIWISEASANLAHKALKNCGFDSTNQDLSELKAAPALLRGSKVLVNVTEDPVYGRKVEIVLDIEPTVAELEVANALLKGRPKYVPPPAPTDGPF